MLTHYQGIVSIKNLPTVLAEGFVWRDLAYPIVSTFLQSFDGAVAPLKEFMLPNVMEGFVHLDHSEYQKIKSARQK